ncbi:hypothetical protein [Yinghuangia seranimata]|uniref:hypothetical protein n=1 Tax=Yinghuangia seranimata TaxID=408067 RepID=UPI00248C29E7|nr:hypothetical protein [Yinghuangia seranimata]MDI2127732.1 hypothetical protein [Yinghuangia seranimata]
MAAGVVVAVSVMQVAQAATATTAHADTPSNQLPPGESPEPGWSDEVQRWMNDNIPVHPDAVPPTARAYWPQKFLAWVLTKTVVDGPIPFGIPTTEHGAWGLAKDIASATASWVGERARTKAEERAAAREIVAARSEAFTNYLEELNRGPVGPQRLGEYMVADAFYQGLPEELRHVEINEFARSLVKETVTGIDRMAPPGELKAGADAAKARWDEAARDGTITDVHDYELFKATKATQPGVKASDMTRDNYMDWQEARYREQVPGYRPPGFKGPGGSGGSGGPGEGGDPAGRGGGTGPKPLGQGPSGGAAPGNSGKGGRGGKPSGGSGAANPDPGRGGSGGSAKGGPAANEAGPGTAKPGGAMGDPAAGDPVRANGTPEAGPGRPPAGKPTGSAPEKAGALAVEKPGVPALEKPVGPRATPGSALPREGAFVKGLKVGVRDNAIATAILIALERADGIFTSDYQNWVVRRALQDPAFASRYLAQYRQWESLNWAQRTADELEHLVDDGLYNIDKSAFTPEIMHFMMDANAYWEQVQGDFSLDPLDPRVSALPYYGGAQTTDALNRYTIDKFGHWSDKSAVQFPVERVAPPRAAPPATEPEDSKQPQGQQQAPAFLKPGAASPAPAEQAPAKPGPAKPNSTQHYAQSQNAKTGQYRAPSKPTVVPNSIVPGRANNDPTRGGSSSGGNRLGEGSHPSTGGNGGNGSGDGAGGSSGGTGMSTPGGGTGAGSGGDSGTGNGGGYSNAPSDPGPDVAQGNMDRHTGPFGEGGHTPRGADPETRV